MKQPPKEIMAAMTTAGDAVLGMAILSGFGAWGGFWLDEKLHTTPLLAISLALIGLGLGLARMVVKAIKADKAGE